MRRVSWVLTGFCVLILPLAGVWWTQGDVAFLFMFPPDFGRVIHQPFNSKLTLAVLAVLPALPVLWHVFKRRDRIYRHHLVLARRHFPKWGYWGYFSLMVFWSIAWTRQDIFSAVRLYTFTPLWLSFIVVVNAHVHRLSNSAPLYKAPKKFALLFLVSALFWWVFEYLNRFTENWNYIGSEVSGLHYVVHGSLCFSTVLPAVYSVFRLLNSRNALHRFFFLGPRIPLLKSRLVSWTGLLAGLIGMLGVGVYPQYFYPFIWLGPLFIFGGLHGLTSNRNKWIAVARGDWRWLAFWALAGGICGFFWELWNFHSLLKWQYQVSFFNGYPVFEMPILGYLGYIPFGVFCGLAIQLVFPKRAGIEFSPNDG